MLRRASIREDLLIVRVPMAWGKARRCVWLPSDQPGLGLGDLFVIFWTADDPRFQRLGRDLDHAEK